LTSPRACHEHSTHNKILHFALRKKKGKVKKKEEALGLENE
jgi:hypothetical protein